jgi:hypothetical protein
MITEYPQVCIVSPSEFDPGTAQTPGSMRLAAIAPQLFVRSALWGGLFKVEPGAHTGIHHHGEQQTVAYVLSAGGASSLFAFGTSSVFAFGTSSLFAFGTSSPFVFATVPIFIFGTVSVCDRGVSSLFAFGAFCFGALRALKQSHRSLLI